jgi:hypothetical protein
LQVPLVLLTNRADRALELYDELSFWLPEGKHLYFPEPNPLSMKIGLVASLGKSAYECSPNWQNICAWC